MRITSVARASLGGVSETTSETRLRGVKSVHLNLRGSLVAEQKQGWAERRRERKRLKRERTGPSREQLAERHTPPETVVDTMLRIGGVERESRFKK